MLIKLGLSDAELFVTLAQLLFGTILVIRKNTKKIDKYLLCFLLGVSMIAIATLTDYCLTSINPSYTTFQAPTRFIICFLYLRVLFKLTISETFYYTGWAYMLSELASRMLLPFTAEVVRPLSDPWFEICTIVLNLTIYSALAVICRKFLIGRLQKEDKYQFTKQGLVAFLIIILMHYMVTDYQFLFRILGYEPHGQITNIFTAYRVLVCIGFISILYIVNDTEKKQALQQELNYIRQLWHYQQEQFETSQSNIELINRKCHNLKHQIAALCDMNEVERAQQICELERSVRIYDAAVKTGNTVLDTVLTEKSLYCEEHQINMTCMADGRKLGFINMVDLYTMFGNALDNAIESVSKLEDKEKRIIQVSIFPENELLMIRIRNYCEENYLLQKGLPDTTKQDKKYHGFGLKSIQYTAEKYNGSISVLSQDNYFLLQILIPIPKENTAVA
ncbi:MAG TPA: ATP-binding protein [Mobilitalea sp.]|nr:ATP-binding protein [Mobilitalea sp.]